MSIRALLWVQQLKGITGSERLVLGKLADHAHKVSGFAYVAVPNIAEHIMLSERQVSRTLTRLLESGRIVVEGPHGRKGGKRPATYRVVIPESFDPFKKDANAGKTDGKQVANAERDVIQERHPVTPTVPHSHRRGDTESAEPVFEPGSLTSNPPPSGRPPMGRARKRVRKLEIDSDWWPDEAGEQFADRKGIRDLSTEVEHFRSHHANETGKVDWAAAWRVWCINFRKFEDSRPRRSYPSGPRGAAEVMGTLRVEPAAEELADESGIIEGGEFGYETRH